MKLILQIVDLKDPEKDALNDEWNRQNKTRPAGKGFGSIEAMLLEPVELRVAKILTDFPRRKEQFIKFMEFWGKLSYEETNELMEKLGLNK